MRASGNNNNNGGNRITAITAAAFQASLQPASQHLPRQLMSLKEFSRNVVMKKEEGKAERKRCSGKVVNFFKVSQLGKERGQALNIICIASPPYRRGPCIERARDTQPHPSKAGYGPNGSRALAG